MLNLKRPRVGMTSYLEIISAQNDHLGRFIAGFTTCFMPNGPAHGSDHSIPATHSKASNYLPMLFWVVYHYVMDVAAKPHLSCFALFPYSIRTGLATDTTASNSSTCV